MTTMQKIIEEINKRNLTAYAISKETGISQMHLGRLLKGETKKPHPGTLKILSDFIFKGKVYKQDNRGNSTFKESHTEYGTYMTVNKPTDNRFIDLGDKFIMLVPFIEDHAQPGFLSGFEDPEFLEELPQQSMIVEKAQTGKYFAFEVIGDSMDNGTSEAIQHRDIVTAQEIPKSLWHSRFHLSKFKDFVIVHKEGILVKRIIEQDVEKGELTLRSLNPDKDRFKDETISLNDVSLLLNIVKISRQR